MVSLAAPVASSTTAQNAPIRWVAPACEWDTSGLIFGGPFLAEFCEDSFMADFLNMITGSAQLNLLPPQQQVGTPPVFKLFQPLHKRYYLVAASLVCRKLGLPDRTVDRKNGEKVSFVLRRLVPQPTPSGQPQQYIEMAWVDEGPNKGWQPLVDDQNNAVSLRKDEERLALHPVKFCPSIDPAGASTGSASPSSPCNSHTIYHGYIPVDKREKYLVPYSIVDIRNTIANSGVDPRLDQVTTQVVGQWRALYIDPATGATPVNGQNLVFDNNTTLSASLSQAEKDRRHKLRYQMSLYLLEDLAEFLKTYLPDIFQAVINSTATISPISHQNLLDLLNTTMMNNGAKSLSQAIRDIQDPNLVAQIENDPFSTVYDIAYTTYGGSSIVPPGSTFLALPDPPTQPIPPPPPPPTAGSPLAGEGLLHQRLREALGDSTTPFPIDADLVKLVKNEPAQGDIFIARMVYERGACDPVVSQPSAPFMFAKIYDTDAPARKIRIEMPSIGLKDLRKHQRGVAFQLPPDLNDLLNRVNRGMLTGGGLADAGAPLGVAMICTFSIPIITICALIVLFIFLILFNIIFWWLPFIRICFPVPK